MSKHKKHKLTKYQKIVAAVIFLPLAPGVLHMFYFTAFRPHDSYFRNSIYCSIGITILIVAWVILLKVKGKWAPSSQWKTNSVLRNFTAITFAPVFIFFMYFLVIGYSLPFYYTYLIGEDAELKYEVIKKQRKGLRSGSGSRFKPCDYYIENDVLKRFLFRACITETEFNQRPSSTFHAQFHVKNSGLGMIVKEISFQ